MAAMRARRPPPILSSLNLTFARRIGASRLDDPRPAPSIARAQRLVAEEAREIRTQSATGRRIGEVPVEADDAPFDAVAKTRKAHVLLDLIDDQPRPHVAQRRSRHAVAPRDIGKPVGAKADLADAVIAADLQRRIPIFALLLRERSADRRQNAGIVAGRQHARIRRPALLGRRDEPGGLSRGAQGEQNGEGQGQTFHRGDSRDKKGTRTMRCADRSVKPSTGGLDKVRIRCETLPALAEGNLRRNNFCAKRNAMAIDRTELREWLEANCPPEMRQPTRGDEDICWGGRNWVFQSPAQKLWLERMLARGFTVPTWPKDYGGAGLSPEETAILHQEMHRIGARAPLVSFGISMLGPALLKFGNEDQKRVHLNRIARG